MDRTEPTPDEPAKVAPPESRLRKIARLAAFCACVGGVVCAFGLRSVYADVQRVGLEIGSELGHLGDRGTLRTVRLNGQAVQVVSTIEARPVEAVLDQVELACSQSSAGLGPVVAALPEKVRREMPAWATDSKIAGILRKEADGEGFVACLRRDEPTQSAGDMLDRFKRVVDTGDLSAIGNLRYVYARTTDTGKAHIVVAWTDGPMNVKSFIADDVDAPGSDLEGFPRPPDSVRQLTAEMDNVPYAYRIYRTKTVADEVLRAYDTSLGATGWMVTHGPDDEPNVRAYSKGGLDVVVYAETTHARTLVSLVHMGATPRRTSGAAP